MPETPKRSASPTSWFAYLESAVRFEEPDQQTEAFRELGVLGVLVEIDLETARKTWLRPESESRQATPATKSRRQSPSACFASLVAALCCGEGTVEQAMLRRLRRLGVTVEIDPEVASQRWLRRHDLITNRPRRRSPQAHEEQAD